MRLVINIKAWSILIYADGNNDMEPEIYKSLLDCQKIGSNNNVNVVMQIGRINKNLLRDMRDTEWLTESDDEWEGVRRYYVEKHKSILIEDLGKSNMADPNNLFKFIRWGVETYEAKHYMVVLSGHGAVFIGGLPDLSLQVPYIMGIPDMAEAVNLVKKKLNSEIDILVLDMCYMNSIEVIYELGRNEHSGIKNMLTYTKQGPYEGLNYEKLICLTEKYSKSDDLKLFLKYLIEGLEFKLAAFEINYEKLRKIKEDFNYLAYMYFSSKDKNIKNPVDFIKNLLNMRNVPDCIKNINEKVSSITIYTNEKCTGINNTVTIVTEDIGNLISLYYKLAFAKNNYWTYLLSDICIDENFTELNKVKIKPKNSSKEGEFYYILNFIQ